MSTPKLINPAVEAAPAVLGHAPPTVMPEQIVLGDTRSTERTTVLRRSVFGADVAAAVCGGIVGAVAGGVHDTPLFVLIATLLWPALVFVCGGHVMEGLGAWASGISEAGRIAGVALVLSWPLAGLAGLLDASHTTIAALTATATTLALSLTGRAAVRVSLHRAAPLRERTVILGSGYVATQLVRRLQRHDEFGLDPIGLVDDDVHVVRGLELPRLGTLSQLRDILEHHHVDRVIIAFTRASHEELLDSMRACREKGVAVDVVPRLFEFLEGARARAEIGGMPLLSIGANRLPRSSALAKRTLDLVIATGALVVALPVLLLIALAIKLDSRGPVFFRQPRVGRKGETFKLLKFRSMYRDADAHKADLEGVNEMDDGVMFKIRRDPRVTRVGGLLRRTSLDELPQFINVLLGQMSVVGPRPLVIPEAEALNGSWHARRLDLRPGITGPWQISGRSDLTVHDMVRMDFQYVTGWSLARDLEILLATVPVVLSGRGAY